MKRVFFSPLVHRNTITAGRDAKSGRSAMVGSNKYQQICGLRRNVDGEQSLSRYGRSMWWLAVNPERAVRAMGNSMKLLRTVPRDRRFPGEISGLLHSHGLAYFHSEFPEIYTWANRSKANIGDLPSLWLAMDELWGRVRRDAADGRV